MTETIEVQRADNGVDVEALLGARAALTEAPEVPTSSGAPSASG